MNSWGELSEYRRGTTLGAGCLRERQALVKPLTELIKGKTQALTLFSLPGLSTCCSSPPPARRTPNQMYPCFRRNVSFLARRNQNNFPGMQSQIEKQAKRLTPCHRVVSVFKRSNGAFHSDPTQAKRLNVTRVSALLEGSLDSGESGVQKGHVP